MNDVPYYREHKKNGLTVSIFILLFQKAFPGYSTMCPEGNNYSTEKYLKVISFQT